MQEPQEMQVKSLGREDPLEKEMATHSSILAWRIPRTGEPEELQSTGSQSPTSLTQLSTRAYVYMCVWVCVYIHIYSRDCFS